MRFIADLHIHSHYSRATSKDMNIRALAKWSQLKGTDVLGTGDFTHPLWFKEIQELLDPAEEGLFALKSEDAAAIKDEIPAKCRRDTRFILSAEISTIYKRSGKVRKVHSVILAPSFAAAAKINATLGRIGNIRSDGRPILGLDTKELLKIVLDASEDCLFIPAHIWTPHFSLYGSQSGFDSLEECFDELSTRIHAVETGLSSDPSMCWRIKDLDTRAIVSNSDAHSPRKLGREANVFDVERSYVGITGALKTRDPQKFLGTIEFYPEEGKYHLDGHRNCQIRMTPSETKKAGYLCPVCKKRMTIGVMHRVDAIADRAEGYAPQGRQTYQSIVPLPDIIAEIEGVGPQSKKVDIKYFSLLDKLGSEFPILLDTPIKDIAEAGGEKLGEAIRKMRAGDISIAGGYDGEFGTVRIFKDPEGQLKKTVFTPPQNSLF